MQPLFNVPRWAFYAFWPLALLATLLATWVVDTAAHAGEVPRNVVLEGETIGGLGEADLRDRIEGMATRFARSTVAVETPDGVVRIPAGELGARVDVDATVAELPSAVVQDPFGWLTSIVAGDRAEVVVAFDTSVTEARLALLSSVRTAPVEPSLDGSTGRLLVLEGIAGQMLDIQSMARSLPDAYAKGTSEVILDAVWIPMSPELSSEDLEPLLREANLVIASGAQMMVNDFIVALPADVAATWFYSELTEDGTPVLAMDTSTAHADIEAMMAPGNFGGSNDAVFDVVGGQVVISATESSRVCCDAGAVSLLLDNLSRARNEVIALPVKIFTPAEVIESAERLGIVEPVASFTTNYVAGQSRVVNIQLFADLVRGHVIEPGGVVSLNEIVGERTRDKGFVEGGFISGGVLKVDIGGGVSQFATTIFNAAFFAGLDFPDYRAHSIYFSRYPYGREATISFPAPDLKLENNTPYGVLIWTSHTDTSVTVTMYSTKHLDAYQTAQTTTFHDQCTRVTTERTRIYHHGEAAVDHVRALYRPDEGFNCDGSPSDPSVTTLPDDDAANVLADGDEVVVVGE